MASNEEVVLLSTWASYFGQRVQLALAEKGVNYEYKEQNLTEKSRLLLQFNPIHKQIPVLIHNGKPICESLIIVQYIDEVWTHTAPLLPKEPYPRAIARFWADFIDKKIFDNQTKIWKSKGEAQEKAKKEYIDSLKLLEKELGEKTYFGDETFGYVDIALLPFTCWFYTLETMANFSVEKESPKLVAWAKRCTQRESVSKTLPHPHKLHEFLLSLGCKTDPLCLHTEGLRPTFPCFWRSNLQGVSLTLFD